MVKWNHMVGGEGVSDVDTMHSEVEKSAGDYNSINEIEDISWEEQVERANRLKAEASDGEVLGSQQDQEDDGVMETDIVTLDDVKKIDRRTRPVDRLEAMSGGSREVVRIGECVVSRESLGEEKVIVEEVKERSKFDILGKKRDKARLEKVLYESNNEDVLKKNFTPSVASLFIEEFKKGPESKFPIRGFATLPLIERLPMEEQMKLISSGDTLGLYSEGVFNMGSKTLSTKFAISLANKIGQGESVGLNFDRICQNHIRDNMESPEDDNWAGDTKNIMLDVFTKVGVNPREAKLSCLSQEEICDNVDDLVGDDTTFWVARGLGKILYNYGREESYERIFPESMKRFLSYNFGHEVGPYNTATIGDFKVMENNADLLKSLGVGESFWLGAVCNNKDLIGQIVDAGPVDDELKNNLQLFFKYPGLFRGFHDIEELRGVSKFLINSARESLANGDILSSKDYLNICCFGATTEDIVKELVSMGAIKTNKKERRDSVAVLQNRSGDDWDVRAGDFSRMFEIGEMNNDQYNLVLEAMAIIGASEDTLSEIMDRVGDGDFRSRGKYLMKSLGEMREKFAKHTSKEYGVHIRECLQNGARPVGEITYEDKKVNVMEMYGKDLSLLVHVVGAFITKENVDDPSRWDSAKSTFSGSGVGYISTSLISNGSLNMATIKRNSEVTDRPIYGFSGLRDDTISTVHNANASVSVGAGSDGGPRIVTRLPSYYESPEELRKNTDKGVFNEVVLNRYGKGGRRLRPDYLVVFTNNMDKIGEPVKKHAAYFGVPILMINPEKYG